MPNPMRKTIDTLVKLRALRLFLLSAYSEWKDQVWERDLDSLLCCDGRECGCDGVTVREAYCEATE